MPALPPAPPLAPRLYLAAALLAAILTACGAAATPADGPEAAFAVPAQPSDTTEPVDPAVTASTVSADVVARLDEFWADVTVGGAWTPPRVAGAYAEGGSPACDGAAVAGARNAYYCSPEDYVAWDADFFTTLVAEDGDRGTHAIAFALAHEWGHAAQARAGRDTTGITAELLADCLAGAWLTSAIGPAAGESDELTDVITALYDAGPDVTIEPHERYREPPVRAETAAEGARNGVHACFDSHRGPGTR